MAWVELLPRYASLLRESGLESAGSLLAWTGIFVNRHRHRQVEQVTLPDEQGEFFLKKQHAVSWRERFRNAWHGFGWCATAVREAKTLQAGRDAGIGCPEVAAMGEDGPRAFVLLRGEAGMSELRTFLPTLGDPEDRRRLAEELGRSLAWMHDAGFEHRDLFAKHILVAQNPPLAGFRFCILDWQRGRQHRAVSWKLRCRDLAALDATLHEALASDRLRLRCLAAYRRTATNPPPLGRLVQCIRREADVRRRQRNIREIGQLPVPAKEQQLVPACEGRLLVVRSYYDQLGGAVPEWLQDKVGARPVGLSWELPALAHTLFRLHRFGVPAPRLLAAAGDFVVTTAIREISLQESLVQESSLTRARLVQQAKAIVRRIHQAGYRLPAGDSWERRLGVVARTKEVILSRFDLLERHSTRNQQGVV